MVAESKISRTILVRRHSGDGQIDRELKDRDFVHWWKCRNCERKVQMIITAEHISPIISLVAGLLILILPSLLNYVIALYLIITGLVGLNLIYHFVG